MTRTSIYSQNESAFVKRSRSLQQLQQARVDSTMPAAAAESALGKDWLTSEEDVAWADR